MLHSEVFYAFLITSVSLTVVATILARFKVPTIIGFILTGVLIGPYGLHWVNSLPAAKSISEIGIIFLMFALGLEISIGHLKKLIRPIIELGILQVVLTIAVGFAFSHFVLKVPTSSSLILGACLALSSTAVVLKLLQERRETETPYGRVGVIILLAQDILALPLMALIPALAPTDLSGSKSMMDIQTAVLAMTIFLLGLYITGKFLIPHLLSEVMRTHSREVFFFSLFSITFVLAFLAEKAGLSMSLGAFAAGVLISESPYNKQALAEFSPLRDVFLGFFFASVGMLFDLGFLKRELPTFLLLVPCFSLLKFSVAYFVVRRASQSHGVSFAAALALTQVGEFSFILAGSAFGQGILTNEQMQYFLALAVASLLFTPSLFLFGVKSSSHSSWQEFAKALAGGLGVGKSQAQKLSNSEVTEVLARSAIIGPRKTVVIGLGHAGRRMMETLSHRGIPCLGVDTNLENIKLLKSSGLDATLGDCTSRDVLEAVGITDAFMVILAVNGSTMTQKIISMIRLLNPSVRLIVRVQHLREYAELKLASNDIAVVSESETANAMIEQALAAYRLEDHALPIG